VPLPLFLVTPLEPSSCQLPLHKSQCLRHPCRLHRDMIVCHKAHYICHLHCNVIALHVASRRHSLELETFTHEKSADIRSFFLSSCRCIWMRVFHSRRKRHSRLDHHRLYTEYIHISGTSLNLLPERKLTLPHLNLNGWILPGHIYLFLSASNETFLADFLSKPKDVQIGKILKMRYPFA
jgi:hypothetical protein